MAAEQYLINYYHKENNPTPSVDPEINSGVLWAVEPPITTIIQHFLDRFSA